MKAFRDCFAAKVWLFAALASAAVLVSSCGRPDNETGSTQSTGSSYSYGKKISFAQNGDAAAIRGTGWSKPEEKFTWTEGNVATLNVTVPPTDRPVTLRMMLVGMINPPELPAQPVEVDVNDQKIADWQVGDTAPFSAQIPPELTKNGGKLIFTFKMPKAVSPKDAGKNADPRVLGICAIDFELFDK